MGKFYENERSNKEKEKKDKKDNNSEQNEKKNLEQIKSAVFKAEQKSLDEKQQKEFLKMFQNADFSVNCIFDL